VSARRSTRDPMKYQDVFWHESFVLRVPKTATGSQALLGGPTAHNGSHAAGLTKTLIDDMVEECGKGLAENMAKWLDDQVGKAMIIPEVPEEPEFAKWEDFLK
jgi:hypothetical protein